MVLRRIFARRSRPRLWVLAMAAFVIFTSFKILDPFSSGQAGEDEEPDRDSRREMRDHQHADVDVNPLKGPGESLNKQQLIGRFLSMYDIPWEPGTLSVTEAWELAASWVEPRSIHPDSTPELGNILHYLSTAPIISADVGHRGTQNKLTLTLQGGQKVAFKPKWYPREYIVEGQPYDGHDRHNGEIVGYHLNRLLGYHRSPIVAGRKVSLEKDIIPVASQRLKETFFKKGNDTCFLGKCHYCKTEKDAACADGDSMEAAIILWLPEKYSKFKKWKSPWQRTYIESKRPKWETDDSWCEKVQRHPSYNHGPILMDLLDAVLMDYLIGNADRHHFETFDAYNDSMLVMFDNAKSFGNPNHDEISILLPLFQCCKIRQNTYERIQQLADGTLSTVIRRLVSHDALVPLLTPPHYKAMDRRVLHILSTVQRCFEQSSPEAVLVNDIYSSR